MNEFIHKIGLFLFSPKFNPPTAKHYNFSISPHINTISSMDLLFIL